MTAEDSTGLVCFTIGHSTHQTEKFIGLLKQHNIQYVVDVRSSPYSQYNPQYNREIIKSELEKNNIFYLFKGDSLGARYNDSALFFNDKAMVDFRKVRELNSFNQGIGLIVSHLEQKHRLTLMCAEKDPFNCHRFVLVSYALIKKGIRVKHILDNSDIIPNDLLEDRLISKYKIDYKQQTLFEGNQGKKDAIEKGYILRNKDIGYLKPEK